MKCPNCSSYAYKRARRNRIQRFLPKSKKYHCSHCKSSYLTFDDFFRIKLST